MRMGVVHGEHLVAGGRRGHSERVVAGVDTVEAVVGGQAEGSCGVAEVNRAEVVLHLLP